MELSERPDAGEANPTLSLTAVLGITFPFNIAIGIPLYLELARRLS